MGQVVHGLARYRAVQVALVDVVTLIPQVLFRLEAVLAVTVEAPAVLVLAVLVVAEVEPMSELVVTVVTVLLAALVTTG